MKNNKNKSVKQQGNDTNKNTFKKASYIGAAVLSLAGLMSLFFAFGVTKGSIRLEQNTPVTLPTLAPTPIPATTSVPPAVTERQQPIQTEMPMHEKEQAEPAAARQPLPPALILPVTGDIMVSYSNNAPIKSKTLGDWRTHNALDIQAATGSEVRAAEDGVVEKAYRDQLMGHTIVIAHEGTYKTMYQNLASTEMVQVGEKVTKGQGIAAVGDSAAAEMLDEPHLHFALYCDDAPLNPLDYVAQ